MRQTSAVARLVAIVVMVVSLTSVVASPAVAQREPHPMTKAQQVRELVLKQREKVLAQIEAIMAGKKTTSQDAQTASADEGGATIEASAPDAGEAAGDEAAGDEAAGGEPDAAGGEADGEGVDVQELPETGIGISRSANGMSPALLAALGALSMICLGVRRRIS
jgi:hypothetical protein